MSAAELLVVELVFPAHWDMGDLSELSSIRRRGTSLLLASGTMYARKYGGKRQNPSKKFGGKLQNEEINLAGKISSQIY